MLLVMIGCSQLRIGTDSGRLLLHTNVVCEAASSGSTATLVV